MKTISHSVTAATPRWFFQTMPSLPLSSWKQAVGLFAIFGLFIVARAQAQVAPPTIAKAFNPGSISVNNSTTLTFTLTNPNASTALTGVSFSDTLPSGLIIANPDSLAGQCGSGVISPSANSISLAGGNLDPGGSCTFSIDVLAVSGGTQVNTTGPVTSNEGGTGGTASATVTVLVPDLTIAKSHNGSFRQTQTGAVYTVVVSNSGGGDTSSLVTVTDTLPAGLTATAIAGTNWSCSLPPNLQCSRGDVLPAGGSFEPITLTVNVDPNAALSLTNVATVSGGGEVNTANDTASDPTTIIAVSDLAISKAHTGNFTPGQTGANYTITVSNVSSGPTVGTVTVVDTLPNVPNTLVATAMSGTGWSCTLNTLTCTRSDVLAGGASYPPITLTVNVPNGIQSNVTNTATVSGGGEVNTANDTATDQTHIGGPIQIAALAGNLQLVRGSTTSTVLTVNSSNGLGTLTLSCSGLPGFVGCSFDPPSLNQLTSQVTLKVTASTLAFARPLGTGRNPRIFAMVLPLFGLLGLVMMQPERRKNKRLRRLQMALLLGIALLLGLAGCGSNLKKSQPGTFSMTVTATSANGTSGSTTINLTVL
ncbi:MAG TPA: hypothetical protein VKZ53_28220 [Candidatus Angelobacter sp.]|nr:hypothetical protein [Candidatus Angelobacter sp.]